MKYSYLDDEVRDVLDNPKTFLNQTKAIHGPQAQKAGRDLVRCVRENMHVACDVIKACRHFMRREDAAANDSGDIRVDEYRRVRA